MLYFVKQNKNQLKQTSYCSHSKLNIMKHQRYERRYIEDSDIVDGLLLQFFFIEYRKIKLNHQLNQQGYTESKITTLQGGCRLYKIKFKDT